MLTSSIWDLDVNFGKAEWFDFKICEECNQECKNTSNKENWCQPCYSKHLQNDFEKWTSGNIDIDKFIQKTQLVANISDRVIEWIPYHKLKHIKYIAKGEFGSVYSAFWLDGKIDKWNINNQQWDRLGYQRVALKILNNSSNSISDFLKELN